MRKAIEGLAGIFGQRIIDKLGFDIVHGCQLRCIGCPNSTLDRKIKTASPEVFNQCLKNIDAVRVKLFRLFNFGEPFLNNDLPEILSYIPSQTFTIDMVEISTNAQHHNFPMLEEALKLGVINRLAVSCDGDGTKEEYERLRPPGKWSKLLEFLSRAKELRDLYAPDVALITRTICEPGDGRKRWEDLLQPLGWTPSFRDWLILPDSQANPAGRIPHVPAAVCGYMSGKNLYIDYDGTVIPCCAHPRAFVLGNMLESRYSDILKGRERKDALRKLKTERKKMPVCGRCEF